MNITKKKKQKAIGKGTDKDKDITLSKVIDILNYHPIDYKFTQVWVNFNNTSESYFRQAISKMNIDDLCDDLFDALIDSEVAQMISSAKEQYTFHFQTINHIRGILKGQMLKANLKCDSIDSDLERYDDQLKEYIKLKTERNIY